MTPAAQILEKNPDIFHGPSVIYGYLSSNRDYVVSVTFAGKVGGIITQARYWGLGLPVGQRVLWSCEIRVAQDTVFWVFYQFRKLE